MKTCEVCSEVVAKYRCPGCAVETCCLKCVNQHKQDNSCDGHRDKTAYVKTKEFTDLNLLSDYRFLEDGGRKNNNASRDNLKRKHNVPNFLKELEKQANRRNVKLRLMPYPMSRRKNNSTIYQHRLKKMFWQIEWIFPQADYTVTDRRVSEDDTLGSILDRHIGRDADPLIRHRLKCYTTADSQRVGVFLKHDTMESSQTSYYRLDVEKSISENLVYKQIVEHPTIHVVLDNHWSDYPLAPEIKPAVDNDKQQNNNSDVITSLASESHSLPSDGTSLPAESTSQASNDTNLHSDGTSLPAESTSLPAESTSPPSDDDTSLPAESTSPPSDDDTCLPVESHSLHSTSTSLTSDCQTTVATVTCYL